MDIIHTITNVLKNLFIKIKKLLVRLIEGVLNFVAEVVNWFKSLTLDPDKDTPFIMDGHRLKQLINEAPVVDIGIFKGVYNEDSETITHYEEVQAYELDKNTKDVLSRAEGDNPIVVLN